MGRSSFRNSYRTFRQMFTFHTLSGCRIRTGDLIGTGTLSGEVCLSCFLFVLTSFLHSLPYPRVKSNASSLVPYRSQPPSVATSTSANT
ncbi:hypothetical protein DFH29DRAFT_329742 [Suillus ampliporus]|nr:hypothetical protein DFH29DRAFT_329742 [Suillus ampliporus]